MATPTQKLIRFKGNWDYRLQGVFDCGVGYSGKYILDAGCNLGIVAYEIGKHRPALIHGIDSSEPAIETARRIFSGYEFPSRFDVVNMANHAALGAILYQQYDVVLFLSVFQHMLHIHGLKPTAQTMALLAACCTATFVAKLSPKMAEPFTEIMRRLDFDPLYDRDPEHRVFTFQRRGVPAEFVDVHHPPPPFPIEDRLWERGKNADEAPPDEE